MTSSNPAASKQRDGKKEPRSTAATDHARNQKHDPKSLGTASTSTMPALSHAPDKMSHQKYAKVVLTCLRTRQRGHFRAPLPSVSLASHPGVLPWSIGWAGPHVRHEPATCGGIVTLFANADKPRPAAGCDLPRHQTYSGRKRGSF